MTRTLNSCLCCDGDLSRVINFGETPLANTYSVTRKYPLTLNRCVECFHLQLTESVDPNILYRDYVYCSGTSRTAFEFFEGFAGLALEYFPRATEVLDIACNDGSQLDAFKRLGVCTTGVDPAENLAKLAAAKGHTVRVALFEDADFSTKPSFDIITAQNVLAHTPSPLTFLRKCADLMHSGSRLFVMTSQANLIANGECDTIYHEHISYFNTRSMMRLAERAGLRLLDLPMSEIHGTSYIFVFAKEGQPSKAVAERLRREDEDGLFSPDTYERWSLGVQERIKRLRDTINDYRRRGYVTVGCGAPAKGISLLNMAGVKLDRLVDTTPTKWNKVASGMKILPFDSIAEMTYDRILFVVLAWNLADEVMENVRKLRINENDHFITTHPSQTVGSETSVRLTTSLNATN